MIRMVLQAYIKRHRKGFAAFIAFSIIYFIIFYLYRMPAESVIYAAALCMVLGILVMIPDYIRFYQKHMQLQKLKKSIAVTNLDLPEVTDLIENDYKELLDILFQEKMYLEIQAHNGYTELIDYYTMWAHQIKTPIAALRLLLQTEQSQNLSELLPELNGEVFKIEQYVEMVLSFLRMESMSSDLLLKNYSLDSIVKQAVRKYASFFIYKKIQLNFTPLNTEILTDEKWVLFVLEQILSNALKYTGENGSISIYMDDRKVKTLVIEDTGIGIFEEDIPRVFEKGFTGLNGRADKKSTGIGLYLCKRILTKLSHDIQIESTAGVGTKVLINFDTLDIFDKLPFEM